MEHIRYNPNTGEFRNSKTGRKIGSIDKRGYVVLRIGNQKYYGHRVAWFKTYGEWPKHLIDHINREPSDNRILNLRLATQQMNSHNNNGNGYCYHSTHKCFQAYIRANGKLYHLGYYKTAQEARRAYLKAKPLYHPTAPIIV